MSATGNMYGGPSYGQTLASQIPHGLNYTQAWQAPAGAGQTAQGGSYGGQSNGGPSYAQALAAQQQQNQTPASSYLASQATPSASAAGALNPGVFGGGSGYGNATVYEGGGGGLGTGQSASGPGGVNGGIPQGGIMQNPSLSQQGLAAIRAGQTTAPGQSAANSIISVDTGVGNFMGMGGSNYTTYGLDPNAFIDQNMPAEQAGISGQQQALQQQQAAQARGVNIGPAAQMQLGQGNQGFGYENSLAQQLQSAAAGNPTAAMAQFQNATDQGLQSQFALANSAQGENRADALKTAMNNQATGEQTAANTSTQLMAQQQQAAQAQLAGVGQNMATQGYGNALQQAQLNQQQAQAQGTLTQGTQLANLTSASSQQAQMNTLTAQYQAMGLSLEQAQFQAQQNFATTQQASLTQQEAAEHGTAISSSGQGAQVAGGVASAIGTVAAAAL